MEVIRSALAMQEYGYQCLKQGKVLGLVPTMGNLHAGHLSLFEELRFNNCDVLAASIFVNPLQFSKGEDFIRYPRTEERDFKMLSNIGCDVVFAPTEDEMFKSDFQTYVNVKSLSKPLCGKFRKGHFEGVATVVLRLYNTTHARMMVFGLKDYQQALVIRKMIEDLNLDLTIRYAQTVREKDGLAMSSRNSYLSAEERSRASAIPNALEWARKLALKGDVSIDVVIKGVIEKLKHCDSIQYVEIVSPYTLQRVRKIGESALLAIAVYVGKTRLIDNVVLGPDGDSEQIV